MGFLDRMVSDMIREATGVNPRRLVRMVGGKNILLAGGAALAGGLLKEKIEGQAPGQPAAPSPPAAIPPPPPGSSPSVAPAAVPPPPPGALPPPPPAAPVAAVPPPPPPVFMSGAADDGDTDLPQELTYAIVRTMVAAAMADGELAAVEKDTIERRLGESGLSAEQVEQVHRDLGSPPSPNDLAALASGSEAREAMYRFAAAVVLADGQVVAEERAWLDLLAEAFELNAEHRASLEKEIFEV